MDTIGSMTREELIRLIDEELDRRLEETLDARLKFLFGEFEIEDDDEEEDTRSLEEVFESIERNRWTPPPGAPSALEILLEERRARGRIGSLPPIETDAKNQVDRVD